MDSLDKAMEAAQEVVSETETKPSTSKKAATYTGALLALLGAAYTYLENAAEQRVKDQAERAAIVRKLDDLEDEVESLDAKLDQNNQLLTTMVHILRK